MNRKAKTESATFDSSASYNTSFSTGTSVPNEAIKSRASSFESIILHENDPVLLEMERNRNKDPRSIHIPLLKLKPNEEAGPLRMDEAKRIARIRRPLKRMRKESLDKKRIFRTLSNYNIDEASQSKRITMSVFRSLMTIFLLILFTYLAFSPGISAFAFHIILMTLSWIFFMSNGINVYSSRSILNQIFVIPNTRKQHYILQIITLIFGMFGILTIVYVKYVNFQSHITTLHGAIGTIAFFIALVNAFLGVGTYKFIKKVSTSRSSSYRFIRSSLINAHSLLGMIGTIGGYLAITVVFLTEWWDADGIYAWVCIVLLAIHFILTIYCPTIRLWNRCQEKED